MNQAGVSAGGVVMAFLAWRVASLFASWWPWQRSQQATAGTRRDKNWRLTSLNPTMSSPKLLAGREGHCREVECVRYVPASSVGKERVCFPLSPLFVAWKKTRHSCTCPWNAQTRSSLFHTPWQCDAQAPGHEPKTAIPCVHFS